MWDFVFLCVVILAIMSTGVVPVLLQISGERNPSPWVIHVSPVADFEAENNHTPIIAATQSHVDVDIPSFSSFESMEVHNESVAEFSNASEPDEEMWNNVRALLADTTSELSNLEVEVSTDEIIPSIPSLTEEQFNAIKGLFGSTVANLITCTPLRGNMGEQVMIGQFFKEGKRLQFDGDWVELRGEIHEEIDGEFIIVKGDFLPDGTFFVQHWEDPEMVEAGYSEFFHSNPLQYAN